MVLHGLIQKESISLAPKYNYCRWDGKEGTLFTVHAHISHEKSHPRIFFLMCDALVQGENTNF
jgi:hypothetical protein